MKGLPLVFLLIHAPLLALVVYLLWKAGITRDTAILLAYQCFAFVFLMLWIERR